MYLSFVFNKYERIWHQVRDNESLIFICLFMYLLIYSEKTIGLCFEKRVNVPSLESWINEDDKCKLN